MKKILSVILLVVMMLMAAGCDGGSMELGGNYFGAQQNNVAVDSYRYAAQSMIDVGNYEEAAKILQEGVEQTGNEELAKMLEEVNGIIQDATETQNPDDITEAIPTEPPVTETPTEVPTEPETQPQSTPIKLSNVQRRINVFLSNFTESFFDTYPCTKYEMVSFAYSHARINNDGKVYYGSREYYISETDVNDILYKYFGITYPQDAAPDAISYTTQYGTETIRYDGDYYYFPAADGEGYSYLSIATEMVRNSDGSYTVKYDAYSLVDFWEDDTNNYYGYSAEQARNSIKLDYMYSGVARVKDYTRTNGVESYQLLEMTRN